MQSYVDYFPDIFDPLVAIKVGDVDLQGRLGAEADYLIEVNSLDDLTSAVEEARGYVGGEFSSV